MDSRKTGTLIAARRCELGLTQKQLAEQLHLSDRTISRWERGVGFPDISLLEPLADALNLSVLELLQGERLESTHEQAEDTVRDAARTFGAKFKTSFRRMRWALIALAVVAVLLLVGYLRLSSLGWLDPYQISTEEISAVDAVEICPFTLLTTEEYDIIGRILREEEIASHIGTGESYTADDSLLRQYKDSLFIGGEPAELVEIYLLSSNKLYITFRTANNMCILDSSISENSVRKTCAQYKEGIGSDPLYIIINQDNRIFSMAQEDSKLSLMLSK